MTLSKDNRLEWIAFWAQWYVQRHGADARVVYDNGSTAYSSEELLETLSAVPGLRVAMVVEWPFPYGPVATPLYDIWDSNYAQHGALEHARWRLLRRAAGFMNADIDELAIDPGGQSVFEAAVRSPTGVVALPGTTVHTAPGSRLDPPRFTDAYWVGKSREEDALKWCAVPPRLPQFAQLTTHEVLGVSPSGSSDHRIWHFYSITTGWAATRTPVYADPEQCEVDIDLKGRLEGAIPPARGFPLVSSSLRDRRVRLAATGRRAFVQFAERVRLRLRRLLPLRSTMS